ncbi:hypothetical protein JCM6882_009515 [Rhodosporidiobolus microsporus]
MRLLDLPPELLSYILDLACPSASPSTLCLVHPTLTPLAQRRLHAAIVLRDSSQIRKLISSPAFQRCAPSIRRLRFIPLNGDGGGRGAVGSGVGTAETIDGRVVCELLDNLRTLWEAAKADGLEGRGIEVFDVASVDPLRPEVLEGEWLSNLSDLTLGTAFLPPAACPPRPTSIFSFRLTSLTLHNNHWQALDSRILSALLQPCEPRTERGETDGTLRHLDLSATYSVDNFGPFLRPLFNLPYLTLDDLTSDTTPPPTLLSSLHTLRLPPFETSSHLTFALSALSTCTATHLQYLELPPLSSATTATYDELWAVLAALFAGGGCEEVGLRGWPTTALVETAKAVLAAAGMDTMPPSPLLGAVGAAGKEEGRKGLRRLRFRKLLAVEEVGKVKPGGAELLEQAEAYGLELICGDRVDESP